jgi:hypothetical protein
LWGCLDDAPQVRAVGVHLVELPVAERADLHREEDRRPVPGDLWVADGDLCEPEQVHRRVASRIDPVQRAADRLVGRGGVTEEVAVKVVDLELARQRRRLRHEDDGVVPGGRCRWRVALHGDRDRRAELRSRGGEHHGLNGDLRGRHRGRQTELPVDLAVLHGLVQRRHGRARQVEAGTVQPRGTGSGPDALGAGDEERGQTVGRPGRQEEAELGERPGNKRRGGLELDGRRLLRGGGARLGDQTGGEQEDEGRS